MKRDTWFVYIVKCKDGTLYTGISNNVDKRVAAHSRGKGCSYTRYRYPVNLIYKKRCGTRSAALKEERFVKKKPRSYKLKLIKKRNKNLAPIV